MRSRVIHLQLLKDALAVELIQRATDSEWRQQNKGEIPAIIDFVAKTRSNGAVEMLSALAEVPEFAVQATAAFGYLEKVPSEVEVALTYLSEQASQQGIAATKALVLLNHDDTIERLIRIAENDEHKIQTREYALSFLAINPDNSSILSFIRRAAKRLNSDDQPNDSVDMQAVQALGNATPTPTLFNLLKGMTLMGSAVGQMAIAHLLNIRFDGPSGVGRHEATRILREAAQSPNDLFTRETASQALELPPRETAVVDSSGSDFSDMTVLSRTVVDQQLAPSDRIAAIEAASTVLEQASSQHAFHL